MNSRHERKLKILEEKNRILENEKSELIDYCVRLASESQNFLNASKSLYRQANLQN